MFSDKWLKYFIAGKGIDIDRRPRCQLFVSYFLSDIVAAMAASEPPSASCLANQTLPPLIKLKFVLMLSLEASRLDLSNYSLAQLRMKSLVSSVPHPR